jgi:hypothetical protein
MKMALMVAVVVMTVDIELVDEVAAVFVVDTEKHKMVEQ